MIVIGLVHRIMRPLIAWLDRRTDAPIMQRHINARSAEYFEWHKAHAGETELDEVLNPTNTRRAD